ncbi:MAG TPA: DUF2130 domain-containing protein [Candidatus Woesebacteria bacterium]|nr:DUF2130 domain-containing protein [Candidatus Woesebacteria bacterium]
MADQTIVCPHCQKSIPLTQALTHQIESAALAKVADQRKLLEDQEIQLRKKQAEVEQTVKESVAKQLETAKHSMWVKAQEEARKKQDLQLKELNQDLAEKTKKLRVAEEAELELRKRARALEERERQLELETERRLESERQKIRLQTQKQESELSGIKLAEKDKQLEILRKTIEDLKRQSEQGSQQVQGDAGEDGIKEQLMINFPKDVIEDVPTGVRGADLIQRVNAQIGPSLATLAWEVKSTKGFSDEWLSKLKKDQGLVQAEVAILVTRSLPKELTNFGMIKQVWVTLPQYAVALATTLRMQLIELAKLKRSLEGQDEKMSALYQYLTGPQFKNRVENLVMAFVQMQQELEKERRSLTTIWKRREGQIQRMLESTANMYGEFQGIIGGALPSIQQLELESGEPNSQSHHQSQLIADQLIDG